MRYVFSLSIGIKLCLSGHSTLIWKIWMHHTSEIQYGSDKNQNFTSSFATSFNKSKSYLGAYKTIWLDSG